VAPVRLVSILVFCLAVPLTAGAQGIATSYRELTLLVRPGDTVTVTDTGGQKVSGKITDLSPSSLALMVDGRPREWRESDVATISHRHSDSLANGALIGLGVGAGFAGAGLLVMVNQSDYDDDVSGGAMAALVALYSGIGAGIGAGIDAMISGQRVIFQRRAGAVSLGMTPLLGPSKVGAGLTLAF
jgi:hypothetical protein